MGYKLGVSENAKYSLRNSTQFLNSKVFKHNSIRKKEKNQEQEQSLQKSNNETPFKMSIEEQSKEHKTEREKKKNQNCRNFHNEKDKRN